MGIIIAQTIHLLFQILSIMIIIKVVLSYFLPPYHPARDALDRLIDPMIFPIRRVIQPVGMFDFSPLVLLIIIQIVDSLITRLILLF